MARIEGSNSIKSPADKVFAYVVDPKTWMKWDSGIVEAEQTSPGQMGVGTTLRGAVRSMGRRTEWTSKVTAYEPNKKLGLHTSSQGMLIEEQMIFDSIESGTKITLIYDVQFGGVLKILAPMVLSWMRSRPKKSLGDLKSILEAQT